MPPKLSRRQQDILEFIQEFMEEHQFPPTVRDIQAGCEISSTSVVDYNLHKLQQNNFLKRLPEVSRGIELIGEGLRGSKRDIISIPIMGNIAAGEPLHVPDAPTTAEEGYDEVDLPASMTGGAQNVFALRVPREIEYSLPAVIIISRCRSIYEGFVFNATDCDALSITKRIISLLKSGNTTLSKLT